ncbi:hypothetical protein RhiirA5_412709 [Rhizophagus irregularis]|uniref:Uncharacterized protein n=1 Tax=Rhizophagus irregularis TaxID=588596 RepID=A0A2I1DYQ0_9GLOM|nr:hypothetical protein RhiirA5_412709 [Rhizophagus irregularis]PKC74909.1 hypothetical protein RhiirA1_449459 [Rhizophagus irregularis]PKY14992.1 hypothetical protein RhiirB3_427104 [Rhizophagus irregularis]
MVQTIALVNNMNIRHEKNILILCKLHINSWIVINKPINIFNDLIKALKTHSSFEIYKNNIKEKLDLMKFEDGNTVVKFLPIALWQKLPIYMKLKLVSREQINRMNSFKMNFQTEFPKLNQ